MTVIKTCIQCGDKFRPDYRSTKLCSDKCRAQRQHKLRRKRGDLKKKPEISRLEVELKEKQERIDRILAPRKKTRYKDYLNERS